MMTEARILSGIVASVFVLTSVLAAVGNASNHFRHNWEAAAVLGWCALSAALLCVFLCSVDVKRRA
jgi:hypothetical protein